MFKVMVNTLVKILHLCLIKPTSITETATMKNNNKSDSNNNNNNNDVTLLISEVSVYVMII